MKEYLKFSQHLWRLFMWRRQEPGQSLIAEVSNLSSGGTPSSSSL